MAQALLDRHSLYEFDRELDPVGVARRFEGRKQNTGTQVLLLRVPLRDPRAELEPLEGLLRRWGAAHNARLPLVFDAWVHGDSFEIAIVQHAAEPVGNGRALELLAPHSSDPSLSLCVQMLLALAALHECNVTHKVLRAECYGVRDDGLIVMTDPGLLAAINGLKAGASADAGGGGMFSLAANFQMRDVADWAVACCDLLTRGRAFTEEEITHSTLRPDRVDQVLEGLRDSLKEASFRALLKRALQGRSIDGNGFEDAVDARETLYQSLPETRLL